MNPYLNLRVVMSVESMMRENSLTRKALHTDGCILFGVGMKVHLLRTEQLALKKLVELRNVTNVFSFKRVKYLESMYTTEAYCKPHKRMGNLVSIQTKNLVSIDKIFVFCIYRRCPLPLEKTTSHHFQTGDLGDHYMYHFGHNHDLCLKIHLGSASVIFSRDFQLSFVQARRVSESWLPGSEFFEAPF